MATAPVAISFLDAPPASVDRFDAPILGARSPSAAGRVAAGCVFWAEGVGRSFSTVPEDHGNCTVGSITHGMLAPTGATGREDLAELVGSGWVHPGVLDELPRAAERPGSVVYGPLSACEDGAQPDVVLLRVDGRQMLVLSDALPEMSIQGKPQCGIVAMASRTVCWWRASGAR